MVFAPHRPRHQPGYMWALVAFLSLAGLWGWHRSAQSVAEAAQLLDGIAAVVNDEIITIGEVHDAMAIELEKLRLQHSGLTLQEKTQALFRRMLQPLIDVHLQFERGRKLGLRVDEEDVAYHMNKLKEQNGISDEQLQQILHNQGLTLERYQEQIRREVLVRKTVNAEVRSRLVILDTELQEAYREQKERYRVAGSLTVSHILFLASSHASAQQEASAKQKAEAVLQQIRRGGDFAELARQYSEGPSAEQGGLLGTFRTGELLPTIEETAAALQPGEISDVVRTQVGWHIVRVEDKKAGAYRPFEEVKEAIKAELSRAKMGEKYRQWLESLRQRAYITILYEG